MTHKPSIDAQTVDSDRSKKSNVQGKERKVKVEVEGKRER
jgi:hypothetical protein